MEQNKYQMEDVPMTSNNPYGKRANGGMHGDVFTKPEIVQYMLDLVGYVSDRNLSELSAIEPSCGEGEILIEMLRRLYKSSLKYAFDFNEAIKKGIVACELDAKKIAQSSAWAYQSADSVSIKDLNDERVRRAIWLGVERGSIDYDIQLGAYR